mgnify:CR=1 FL=1
MIYCTGRVPIYGNYGLLRRLLWHRTCFSPPMALNYHLNPEYMLGRISGEGSVSDGEIVATVASLMDSPDFREGMDILIDLREVDSISVTTAGIREVALLMQEDSRVDKNARIATIVKDRFTYGIVKMFQGLTRKSLPNQVVTESYQEALSYIRCEIPVDAVFS